MKKQNKTRIIIVLIIGIMGIMFVSATSVAPDKLCFSLGGGNFCILGNNTISGNLNVTGNITAQYYCINNVCYNAFGNSTFNQTLANQLYNFTYVAYTNQSNNFNGGINASNFTTSGWTINSDINGTGNIITTENTTAHDGTFTGMVTVTDTVTGFIRPRASTTTIPAIVISAGTTTTPVVGSIEYSPGYYYITPNTGNRLKIVGTSTLGSTRVVYGGVDPSIMANANFFYTDTSGLLSLDKGQISITGNNGANFINAFDAITSVGGVGGMGGAGSGFAGGGFSFTGGVGGVPFSASKAGGTGGSFSFTGGTGGAGTTANSNGGNGGNAIINTGAGGAPGAGGIAGGVGSIFLQQNSVTKLTLDANGNFIFTPTTNVSITNQAVINSTTISNDITTRNINASGNINSQTNFSVNGKQGITGNYTIMKTAVTTCTMNFTGGILWGTDC